MADYIWTLDIRNSDNYIQTHKNIDRDTQIYSHTIINSG